MTMNNKLYASLLLLILQFFYPIAIIAQPIPTASPSSVENAENESSSSSSSSTNSDESIDPEILPPLSPEELIRQQKFIEADTLYQQGKIKEATQIYQQLKPPYPKETQIAEIPPAVYDVTQLTPAGGVYWRLAQQGIEQNLISKTLVSLKLLTTEYPQFIPGQIAYIQALKDHNKLKESLEALDKAVAVYDSEPDLLKFAITLYAENKRWLEGSLLARRFALMNPDHPQAKEFLDLADKNLKSYQSYLGGELRGNLFANIITGALGAVLTGGILGPLSALESLSLMLQGESALGSKIADEVKNEVPILEDEELNAYVNEIGGKLAKLAGRNEFEYQFYIIMDDDLNAFALPGGKVFVNLGAILKTESEAELAGLLSHELSHAVLSHTFQLVTEGNLTLNLGQFIPFGGTLTNIIVLGYSREMEQQADIFGTKILASSGYAADGMRDLMAILEAENKNEDRPPAWLSTHPETGDRVNYLENLVVTNGYNRYGYEGVERHWKMREKAGKIWQDYKQTDDYCYYNRNDDEKTQAYCEQRDKDKKNRHNRENN